MSQFNIVIDVTENDEVSEFKDWLIKNRHEVIAISENRGCQCCVDIFTVDLSPYATPLPKRLQANGADEPVFSGARKDEIIDEFLSE